MKILNFGSCNVDGVYRLPHFVRPGETLAAQSFCRYPGGKGLNQSIALARAGSSVFHAGCVGEDDPFLRRLLCENGVDTTYLATVSAPTGQAVIFVNDSGENSIVLYPGANAAVTQAWILQVLSHFSEGDLLLLQNEISGLRPLISAAHAQKMRIIWNPAPFDPSLHDLDLSELDWLICNETEAAGFFGEDQPEAFLTHLASACPKLGAVVTLGKQGCIYTENGKIRRHPAYQVQPVDTTAAGDTFVGYFTAQISAGKDAAQAVRLASAAAALATTKAGAASSIPTLAEVRNALRTLIPYPPASETENKKDLTRTYFSSHLPDARLSELAAVLHYSPYYACRWLRKTFGASFSDLLQKARCEAAAELLAKTDLPVSEIISRVGYQNASFFRACFDKQYALSPSQYRAQCRAKESISFKTGGVFS